VTGVAGAQVGETRVVNLPGSTFGGDKERRLQVLVRAEGPTCVLSVTDLVVRPARRTPQALIASLFIRPQHATTCTALRGSSQVLWQRTRALAPPLLCPAVR